MFEHLVARHEDVFLQRLTFGSGKRRVFADRLAKSSEAKKSSTSAAVESTILQAGAAAGLALIQKEEEMKLQQASAKNLKHYSHACYPWRLEG
jgi:hypothetical protein